MPVTEGQGLLVFYAETDQLITSTLSIPYSIPGQRFVCAHPGMTNMSDQHNSTAPSRNKANSSNHKAGHQADSVLQGKLLPDMVVLMPLETQAN